MHIFKIVNLRLIHYTAPYIQFGSIIFQWLLFYQFMLHIIQEKFMVISKCEKLLFIRKKKTNRFLQFKNISPFGSFDSPLNYKVTSNGLCSLKSQRRGQCRRNLRLVLEIVKISQKMSDVVISTWLFRLQRMYFKHLIAIITYLFSL